MGAVSSRVRIALSSGASGLEPGREFLQDRLGVFGFWNGVLSLFFLILRFVGEALVLHAALGNCRSAGSWTSEDARAWWRAHGAEVSRARPGVADPDAVTVTVDIADR